MRLRSRLRATFLYIGQIKVTSERHLFIQTKCRPASFGCWVYRTAMQIYRQYQFHAVSFACIIQEDLKLPVLCVAAFSTPNKIYQQKPYLCTCKQVILKKGRVHGRSFHEMFCKPNLFTVQLHQHWAELTQMDYLRSHVIHPALVN